VSQHNSPDMAQQRRQHRAVSTWLSVGGQLPHANIFVLQFRNRGMPCSIALQLGTTLLVPSCSKVGGEVVPNGSHCPWQLGKVSSSLHSSAMCVRLLGLTLRIHVCAPPPHPFRSLMKELERLIGDGQITARIDSQNKVLYAR
jgi:hypothetical protein